MLDLLDEAKSRRQGKKKAKLQAADDEELATGIDVSSKQNTPSALYSALATRASPVWIAATEKLPNVTDFGI